LFYLANPVDKFFMQVQGSGRIKLRDGSMVRVSYDGKNGHPYTSIGRHLIDTGVVDADKMSLEALSAWLKADAERGRKVMELNKSYVFFRELKGEEAKGALGVLHIPLSPGRSLAVDAGFHAIGLPIYVISPTLKHNTWSGGFNRLMVAQDVGSAIKGPERGDIYFGTGDVAGKLAGNTKHPGNLFVLLPGGASATVAKAAATVSKSGSDISTGSTFQRAEP
jgi:membrane-bound lytic murein transglycosylase A